MQDHEQHRDPNETPAAAAPAQPDAAAPPSLDADADAAPPAPSPAPPPGETGDEAMRVLEEIDEQVDHLRALEADQAQNLDELSEKSRQIIETCDETVAAVIDDDSDDDDEPCEDIPAIRDRLAGDLEPEPPLEPVQLMLSQSEPAAGADRGDRDDSEHDITPASPVEMTVEAVASPVGEDEDPDPPGANGQNGNGPPNATLRGRVAGLEAKVARLELELDATAAARNFARREVEVLEQRMERMRRKQDQHSAQTDEYRSKLSEARDHIGRLIDALEEHTPQLERGAAAVTRAAEQEAEIERLNAELEQLRSAENAEVIAGLTQQVETLQVELEAANSAAELAQSHLAERAAAPAPAAADPEMATRLAEREEQVTVLMREIETLREKLEDSAQEHRSVRSSETKEMEQLRSKVQELRKSLNEARAGEGGPVAADDGQQADFEAALELKTRRIAEIARHLKTRRQRLRRVRQHLRDRGEHPAPTTAAAAPAAPAARNLPEDMEERAAQIRQLEKQRIELAEMRQQLTTDEKKMVRRWARPRAAATLGWLVILALISAGTSWMTTNHFFPATIAAMVQLDARQQNRLPLHEDTAKSWQEWHRALVADPNFQKDLARRFSERKMTAYETPEGVKARLDADLSIGLAAADKMTLTLAGKDPEETKAFLDLLASSITLESRRAVEKRPEAAWAVVHGGTQASGRGASTLNPVPVHDQRLYVAGPMFGVSYVIMLVAVIAIYRRLIKAKRVFDESDDIVLSGAGAFQRAA
jgi:hypothetical protein